MPSMEENPYQSPEHKNEIDPAEEAETKDTIALYVTGVICCVVIAAVLVIVKWYMG